MINGLYWKMAHSAFVFIMSFVQYEALTEIFDENFHFRFGFMGITSLYGPTYTHPFTLSWIQNLPENLPYFALPMLLCAQMFIYERKQIKNRSKDDRSTVYADMPYEISEFLPYLAYSFSMMAHP